MNLTDLKLKLVKQHEPSKSFPRHPLSESNTSDTDSLPVLSAYGGIHWSSPQLDGPEEVIVLDEYTGIVARVKTGEIPLAIVKPRYQRMVGGHLGAVEV